MLLLLGKFALAGVTFLEILGKINDIIEFAFHVIFQNLETEYSRFVVVLKGKQRNETAWGVVLLAVKPTCNWRFWSLRVPTNFPVYYVVLKPECHFLRQFQSSSQELKSIFHLKSLESIVQVLLIHVD